MSSPVMSSLGTTSPARRRLKCRPPRSLSLKYNRLTKNPRPAPASPALPRLAEKANVVAGVAAGADVVAVDAVASEPLPRLSLLPLQKALSPSYPGPKKRRRKKDRGRIARWKRPNQQPLRKLRLPQPLCPQRRHVHPKASSSSPSDSLVRARVPGSSAITWSRSPATWSGRFYFTTFASSAFRISCFPTCAPCSRHASSPSVR